MSSPLIVRISGMFRSGSTWSFNVARLLLSAHVGSDQVYTEATEAVGETLNRVGASRAVILLKGHSLDDTAKELIRSGEARLIHTYRDPGPAIQSGIRAFGFTFDDSLLMIAESVEIMDFALAHRNGCFIFHDDIASRPEDLIRSIASYLGVPAEPEMIRDIAENLRRDKIREFTDSLNNRDALSEARTLIDIGFSYYDAETMFHRAHVSAENHTPVPLTEDQLHLINQRLHPHVASGRFRQRISYMATATGVLPV